MWVASKSPRCGNPFCCSHHQSNKCISAQLSILYKAASTSLKIINEISAIPFSIISLSPWFYFSSVKNNAHTLTQQLAPGTWRQASIQKAFQMTAWLIRIQLTNFDLSIPASLEKQRHCTVLFRYRKVTRNNHNYDTNNIYGNHNYDRKKHTSNNSF